jgi:hypothetical protein
MPRLPVDGKKVIEHRISLSGVERRALQSLVTSERLKAIDLQGKLEILEDPTRIIQIAYGIATALELIGIESGFPLPTISDVTDYFSERDVMGEIATETGRQSIKDFVLDFLRGEGAFEGLYPGGY